MSESNKLLIENYEMHLLNSFNTELHKKWINLKGRKNQENLIELLLRIPSADILDPTSPRIKFSFLLMDWIILLLLLSSFPIVFIAIFAFSFLIRNL